VSLLYEPQGRASKYARLAANIHKSCSHGCYYCYCPRVLHIDPRQFLVPNPQPKANWNPQVLTADIRDWVRCHPGQRPYVHLCFIGDPFPMGGNPQHGLDAVNAVHAGGLPVQVLTKGVPPPELFDILTKDDLYGTTLTTVDNEMAAKVEPRAANPELRVLALTTAHRRGIPVWLSHEPVIDSYWSIPVLQTAADLGINIKPLWIGPLNHCVRSYDWVQTKLTLLTVATNLGLTVQFKE